MPSQEELCRIFTYDKETGILYRNGRKAGWYDCRGKRFQTSVNFKRLYVHRIIWVMHHGDIQDGLVIDHIDHDATNNRIENLRCVTRHTNHKNRSLDPRNTSGYSNIYWKKVNRKWCVAITVDGRPRYKGLFDNIDEAVKVRDKALREYGFHPNHGK